MKQISLRSLLAISVMAILCSVILGGVSAAVQSSQDNTIATIPLKLDRLDASIDHIVTAGAKLERVATGFTWTEGPVWVQGKLYFAEIPSNSIRVWTPGKGVAMFLEPSGYKGSAPYGGPESGSNGMTLDAQGRLTVAGHAQRDVYRLESLSPNAQQTVLADSYKGKKLNSPNDVVFKSDGSLYFTDPPYGLRTQSDKDSEKEQTVNGVYRIPHALAQKPGSAPARDELQLLVTDLTRPNGIALSPDEKYLFVSNSQPKKYWMRYSVQADGTVNNPKMLLDVTPDNRPGVPDGMKVDMEGNIYSAGPGGIWIISPEGKALGTIVVPGRTSNVAWAGPDRKTLYITGSEGIFRVHLNIAGEPLIKGK